MPSSFRCKHSRYASKLESLGYLMICENYACLLKNVENWNKRIRHRRSFYWDLKENIRYHFTLVGIVYLPTYLLRYRLARLLFSLSAIYCR